MEAQAVLEMSRAYLLTGEPRIGKTRALKKMIDVLGREHCGGFYTEEIDTEEVYAQDKRAGFRLVTLDGRNGILAHVQSESPIRVGRYGVNLDCLESIGIAAINEAIATKELIVVDEIGLMQAYSDPFKSVLLDVLHHSRLLLGTIALESHPWLDAIKQHEHVVLYELTASNQASVIDRVTAVLSSTLRRFGICCEENGKLS
jgi:nucleoside-triphosphatase